MLKFIINILYLGCVAVSSKMPHEVEKLGRTFVSVDTTFYCVFHMPLYQLLLNFKQWH